MYKASEANKLAIENNKSLNKSVIDTIMDKIDEAVTEAVNEGKFEASIGFGAICKKCSINDAAVIRSIHNTVSSILNNYGYDSSLRYYEGRLGESILTISFVNTSKA